MTPEQQRTLELMRQQQALVAAMRGNLEQSRQLSLAITNAEQAAHWLLDLLVKDGFAPGSVAADVALGMERKGTW